MSDVVIVDAIRTPIGSLGGVLASVRPDDLAALVIKSIVERNQLDPALVEEVYFGCANQAGEDNRNVARMASLLAGLPVEVGGVTVNRLCASGLNAVNQAARAIRSGEGDVYIAGGVKWMSRAPYSLPKAETGYSFGNLTAYDTALGWRYPNPKMKEMYGTEFDGGDGREYCQGTSAYHAREAGCFCVAFTSARHCCHQLRQIRRRDFAGSDPAKKRRSAFGDDR